MNRTTRRELLKVTAIGGVALAAFPFLTWAQEQTGPAAALPRKGKRLLFFTKSQRYPHSVVTRKKNADGTPVEALAFAENLVKQWAEKAGYEIVVTKDGGLFTPEQIAGFDAFIFYTTGDLTKPPAEANSDHTPAMPEAGKAALLKAIEGGKGFIGLHSATDTFEDLGHKNDPPKIVAHDMKLDPYCAMIGAEFTSHGSQQQATLRVGSKTFPGLADLQEFTATEEWYGFTNFAPDLHVILVQDTATMKVDAAGKRERQYQGNPYPETWARMHNKGRVFYTGMGHREDIWTNPLYQKLLLAAMAWATGIVAGELKGNIAEICPEMAKIG